MKQPQAELNLIPMPREIEIQSGKCLLDSSWTIIIDSKDPEDRFAAELLAQEAKQTWDLNWKISRVSQRVVNANKNIVIQQIPVSNTAPKLFNEQGYELVIERRQIIIQAATSCGRFYGIQTLRQLIRSASGKSIPQLTIKDYPALTWRGVSDDISRGQVSTIADFKSIIQKLAFYKNNIYMPYIEDMFCFDVDPDIGRTRGAITKSEMQIMVETAKQYHITLCPVFECLGHQKKILSLMQNRKYAELPDPAKMPWSFSPVIPAAFDFVTKLIDEMVAATPGPEFFHIGCDESYDVGLGTSKKQVAKIGIGRVHADYFTRLHDYLRDKHHRKTILYGDMLLKHPEAIPYLPKDCIIMDWQYEPEKEYPSVNKFLNAGFKHILISGSVRGDVCFYPDNYVGFINIRNFAAVAKKENLLGSIVSAWGDHGAENLRENNLLGYAYNASASWEPDPTKNQSEFIERFIKLYYRIENPKPLARAEELIGFLPGYAIKSLFGIFHSQFTLREQDAKLVASIKKLRNRIQPILEIIPQERAKAKLHQTHLDNIEHSAKRYLYFANRVIAQDEIAKKLKRAKSGTLSYAEQQKIAVSLISLQKQLTDIYGEYPRLWLKSNKYPDLDINLNRLVLQISQLQNYIAKATAGELQTPKPMDAVWMWYPQGEPTKLTEMGTYYFIRPISILKKELSTAELIVWADDFGKVYLNGQELFTVSFRDNPKQISVKGFLKPGENILAIEAINGLPTYAGLVMELRLIYADGKKETISGDKQWRVTDRRISNWFNHLPSASDKTWVPVKLLGKGFISAWSTKIDWP
ncbi:MAG: glycoside hydrolase family 20 zincin-like fold domain-containing protein [bacterium]